MLWLSQVLVREKNGHRKNRLTWILSCQTTSLRSLKILQTQGNGLPLYPMAPYCSWGNQFVLHLYIALYEYTHMCVFVCVCIRAHMHTSIHSFVEARGQCWVSHSIILYFLRQAFSLNLEPTVQPDRLASELQRSACFCFPPSTPPHTHFMWVLAIWIQVLVH